MAEEPKQRTFEGKDARQGEIILRTPMRRAIFIAGLAGFVILVLLLGLF
ncbi:hypothetical protein L598_002300000510 [Mesorhizobium sp. J18]|nr:peptide ABC transporter permease [Mesorhizobium sp. J18]TWG97064.1 hypothetical protein L598_002300000510 [Mesorhizobium sp. J18]